MIGICLFFDTCPQVFWFGWSVGLWAISDCWETLLKYAITGYPRYDHSKRIVIGSIGQIVPTPTLELLFPIWECEGTWWFILASIIQQLFSWFFTRGLSWSNERCSIMLRHKRWTLGCCAAGSQLNNKARHNTAFALFLVPLSAWLVGVSSCSCCSQGRG